MNTPAIIIQTPCSRQVVGSAQFKPDTYWNADNNIKEANRMTNYLNPKVDTMSWWCDYGGGSTAGIAYVGALCSGHRTNLNEYQSTQSASGFVSIV